jgi:hypothetical protein
MSVDNRVLRIYNDGEPFLGEYIAHLEKLNSIVRNYPGHFEGSIFYQDQSKDFPPVPDVAFMSKRKNWAFFSLFGSSMLEIGFNAGHSALLALTTNPTLHYTGVDLGGHSYTIPCFEYLKEIFKDRIDIFIGDSTKVLKDFSYKSKKYDLASVDGGHDFQFVTSDLAEICRISASGTPVIIDDIGHPPIRAAILSSIAQRRLKLNHIPLLAGPTDQIFLEVI